MNTQTDINEWAASKIGFLKGHEAGKLATGKDWKATCGRPGSRVTAREMRLGRSYRSLAATSDAYKRDRNLFRGRLLEIITECDQVLNQPEVFGAEARSRVLTIRTIAKGGEL